VSGPGAEVAFRRHGGRTGSGPGAPGRGHRLENVPLLPPRRPPRSRGALTNREGRYEALRRLPEPSGESGEEAPRPPTRVTPERTRRILSRNDSPDVPFDQSVNPYKGCEHGCVYCFARPTHAYLGLSPGLDFETRIVSKPEAPDRLECELGRPGYTCRVLALGANTDPYQPVEREQRVTRGILERLAALEHPVSVVTKSDLVLRDLDLLAPMARKRLASVFVSVTSLDPVLARRMEPRAPTPERRLRAVRELHGAGVPVGVLASPMIPALNDAELEGILEECAVAGARWARYILLRLPLEVKELFAEWLEAEYPDRAARILGLVRETRGGALYRSGWGERMRGTGRYAELLESRFAVACRRLRLNVEPVELDTTRFRGARAGTQLELFR